MWVRTLTNIFKWITFDPYALPYAIVNAAIGLLLDKKAMRRIKLGEQQFRHKQYVTVKGPKEIRRVLST